MIERGTHPKMKFRADNRARARGQSTTDSRATDRLEAARAARARGEQEESNMRDLFNDYMKARKECGQGTEMNYRQVRAALRNQAVPSKARVCKDVKFKVKVKWKGQHHRDSRSLTVAFDRPTVNPGAEPMILERRDWLLWTISQVVWRYRSRLTQNGGVLPHRGGFASTCLPLPKRRLDATCARSTSDTRSTNSSMPACSSIEPVLAGDGKNRTRAMLETPTSSEHGINQADSLFSQLGEMEFWPCLIAEQGAQQFDVYADLMKDDADTREMFAEIADDERFHRLQSRGTRPLRVRRGHGGGQGQVRPTSVFFEAWLDSVWSSATSCQLWLGILYILVIGPSSIFARLTETTPRDS